MQDLSLLTQEELVKLAGEQAEKIVSLEAELETTTAVNKTLTLQIEEAAATVIPEKKDLSKVSISSETFEVDGETYSFAMAKICLGGSEVITADEVLASPELQAQLVTSESGMIKKITIE